MAIIDFSECVRIEDYVDDAHLAKLRDYRYSAVDLSPTTKYILRHWWNWVAEWMPRWLAPNMITLIGLFFILVNIATVAIYMPDLASEAPRWVYFSFAIGLFSYQTLDNVDGKQARKTGTSSPLGELFDHGIDSLNCVLGGLIQCAAIGTGQSFYSVFIVVVACWPMYLSTWEEYHTGVLYLGFINGPTEGLLIAMAILLNSGFNGNQIWHSAVKTKFDLPIPVTNFFAGFGHELKFLDLFVLFVLVALVIGHAPFCFYNVWKSVGQARKRNLKSEQARLGLIGQPLLRLLPLLVYTGASVAWITSPTSHLLENKKLMEWSLMLCLIFGRMSTRTILAHLTKGAFPFWSAMMLPLIMGSILVNLPTFGLPTLLTPFGELIYLRLSVFLSFVGYWLSTTKTIERFCEALQINCLTIRKK
ncbi:CDP-alcohol phosphatidyltransferase-domain-containing protein [Melampsora americana]|nr:CDP-alcohol phosphatidyltransferase-domain-containing protein [Melampsora americana]